VVFTVLGVEKDKWGFGNLGGVDDRVGPEFEARVRSAEDRGAQRREGWDMERGLPPIIFVEKLYAKLCTSEHSGS
jgi:hypothetical protein